MQTVKVTYSDGNTITTGINGTEAEIREYFAIGRVFNIGSVEDNCQKVTALEFITPQTESPQPCYTK